MVVNILNVLIITNNPLVRDTYRESAACTRSCVEVCYVAGDVLSLMLRVRDMIYEGYPLLGHPLPASIRIIYSPYRSVMVGAALGELDPWHAEVVEESLRKYRQTMARRTPDEGNAKDYAWVDLQLLAAALKEPRPFA